MHNQKCSICSGWTLLAVILLFGCKSASTHSTDSEKKNKTVDLPSIQLKENQINKIQTGQKVYVEEFQNASTGAEWNMIHEPDSTVLKLVDTDYKSESDNPEIVGAGGVLRWNYIALKPGKDSLVMWYGRSWEDRRPENQPARFHVEITDK